MLVQGVTPLRFGNGMLAGSGVSSWGSASAGAWGSASGGGSISEPIGVAGLDNGAVAMRGAPGPPWGFTPSGIPFAPPLSHDVAPASGAATSSMTRLLGPSGDVMEGEPWAETPREARHGGLRGHGRAGVDGSTAAGEGAAAAAGAGNAPQQVVQVGRVVQVDAQAGCVVALVADTENGQAREVELPIALAAAGAAAAREAVGGAHELGHGRGNDAAGCEAQSPHEAAAIDAAQRSLLALIATWPDGVSHTRLVAAAASAHARSEGEQSQPAAAAAAVAWLLRLLAQQALPVPGVPAVLRGEEGSSAGGGGLGCAKLAGLPEALQSLLGPAAAQVTARGKEKMGEGLAAGSRCSDLESELAGMCIVSLTAAARQRTPPGSLVIESRHPLGGDPKEAGKGENEGEEGEAEETVDEHGDRVGRVRVVHVPGARALQVVCDARCDTEPGVQLCSFYWGEGCAPADHAVCFSGRGPARFRSFLVPGCRLFFRFEGSAPLGSATRPPFPRWGYRFAIVPLGLPPALHPAPTLAPHAPPLQLGLWLADYLLGPAAPLGVRRRALQPVGSALAVLAATPHAAVPSKAAMFRRLTRLFRHLQLCRPSAAEQLEPTPAGSSEAAFRAEGFPNGPHGAEKLFPPDIAEEMLQQLGVLMGPLRALLARQYRQPRVAGAAGWEPRVAGAAGWEPRVAGAAGGRPTKRTLRVYWEGVVEWQERDERAPFSAFLQSLAELCIVAAPEAAAVGSAAAWRSPLLAHSSSGGGELGALEGKGCSVPSAAESESSAEPAVAVEAAEGKWREGPASVKLTVLGPGLDLVADGLLAHNASGSCQSVRADSAVRGGSWYYEVALRSGGLVQIGWCTPQFRPSPAEGSGVGDDERSWAYDGYRRRFWHGEFERYGATWHEGDVVGVAVKLEPQGRAGTGTLASFRYFLNGRDLGEAASRVRIPSPGTIHPAASLASGERCRFNFGQEPFRHPPPREYTPLHAAPSSEGTAAAGAWFRDAVEVLTGLQALRHGAVPASLVGVALRVEMLCNRRQWVVPGRLELDSGQVQSPFPLEHAAGDFSISLWLRVSEPPTGAWRTLLFKGMDKEHTRTPAAFLAPDSMRVALCVSTVDYWNDCLRSQSELPVGQWVHLALVRSDRCSRIYLNGVLDADRMSDGPTLLNHYPLYVGRTPPGVKKQANDYAGVTGTVQGICFHARALASSEVYGMASDLATQPQEPAPAPAPDSNSAGSSSTTSDNRSSLSTGRAPAAGGGPGKEASDGGDGGAGVSGGAVVASPQAVEDSTGKGAHAEGSGTAGCSDDLSIEDRGSGSAGSSGTYRESARSLPGPRSALEMSQTLAGLDTDEVAKEAAQERWSVEEDAALLAFAATLSEGGSSQLSKLSAAEVAASALKNEHAGTLPPRLAAAERPWLSIATRFAALKCISARLGSCLPLLDFTAFADSDVGCSSSSGRGETTQTAAEQSIAGVVCSMRERIFLDTKLALWDHLMGCTRSIEDRPTLRLNRLRQASLMDGGGSASAGSGKAPAEAEEPAGKGGNESGASGRRNGAGGRKRGGVEVRHTMFGQAWKQLKAIPPSRLRLGDRCWSVTLEGEGAEDCGGPYRESLSQMCAELQTEGGPLQLLLPCPNASNRVGTNQDKWVPNPSASSAAELSMLHFLGHLFGIALRTKDVLDLNLPGVVWRPLVGLPLRREDLAEIDATASRTLAMLRNIQREGVTEDNFAQFFVLTFTTSSLDGRTVEVVEGGANKVVTWHNRGEYCDAVEAFRLREVEPQVAAIRAGLAEVVPQEYLRLFTAAELEVRVCGNPVVDIAALRQNAVYSGVSAERPLPGPAGSAWAAGDLKVAGAGVEPGDMSQSVCWILSAPTWGHGAARQKVLHCGFQSSEGARWELLAEAWRLGVGSSSSKDGCKQALTGWPQWAARPLADALG
ncbi:hypothetical protein CYMTET_53159 [Cymbomonas tetramitiformis]|uniref:HECT domain-containing protein n=1 Tax=Cymbomonas tetramitiformis TaxID=36881 RepID=A0AAE0BHG2_9CHLO|nr:hypothetical protein CYMTET_53159 [Cymbomonas tetramitiformis]